MFPGLCYQLFLGVSFHGVFRPFYRLVLATTFSCQAVPSSIAAYVNVVEFSQSRDGLEEMFLDRFLRLEKPRMQDTRTQVVDVSDAIFILD